MAERCELCPLPQVVITPGSIVSVGDDASICVHPLPPNLAALCCQGAQASSMCVRLSPADVRPRTDLAKG